MEINGTIINMVQNLGAPIVYSLLALWFIKYQFQKNEEQQQRSEKDRKSLIDDFNKRDSENDKRAFDLAERGNQAINKMVAGIDANTKSMDALLNYVTSTINKGSGRRK
jgi:hypothetical protein|tara:strand:+ start:45 stop:371 length:327 start_codon:yes stop_codon:yes gene_type:complete